MRRTLPARGTVRAPRPGPISRNTSSGCGDCASRSLATHAASRKCWPNRFLARGRGVMMEFRTQDADVPEFRIQHSALLVFISAKRLAAPVPLLDVLDLFLAHAEVMANFMNERLADDRAHVIFVVAVFFDRPLEERDSIREIVSIRPGSL